VGRQNVIRIHDAEQRLDQSIRAWISGDNSPIFRNFIVVGMEVQAAVEVRYPHACEYFDEAPTISHPNPTELAVVSWTAPYVVI
jgi:hypothetical protein